MALHAVDLHEDLVETPTPMPEAPHRLDPVAPDLGRENRPEPVPPEPHRFMSDVDRPFMKQVLGVPERKRVADIHHDRQADDLGRSLEVENDGSGNPQ
jgi:hypothetical protein